MYGKITGRIPNQTGEVKKYTLGHFGLRDNTGSDLIHWL